MWRWPERERGRDKREKEKANGLKATTERYAARELTLDIALGTRT
jgi:hypothetical protein